MDEKTRELISLLDAGLAVVQHANLSGGSGESVLAENLSRLSYNLEALKDAAAESKLPRQSRGHVDPGTGLALTRTVGEWSSDQALYDAMFRIEQFYRHEF
ncbi:MAG: hypothetical protein ABI770_03115 [Sphingomicrobium sp.]